MIIICNYEQSESSGGPKHSLLLLYQYYTGILLEF